MPIRYFSLIMGLILTLMAVLSFFPSLLLAPSGVEYNIIGGYGYLMGLFATNALITFARLGLGIWGVFAYRTLDGSRLYAQTFAFLYGAMAVMGLIPGFNSLFSLMPLFGHNIWLHAITAGVGAYYGFFYERTHHIDLHVKSSLQH